MRTRYGQGVDAGQSGNAGEVPSPAPVGVCVVMPVLNEGPHLRAAVAAVLSQNWPGPFEVVLAVGPSKDNTEDVATQLAAADQRVRVVANPSGRTPDALNAAIAASSYPVVVRVDAHSELPEGYIATAVETLERTGADNVGGVMWPVGRTPFEVAVALAMTSPVGVGAAAYHTGGDEGPSESVYLGAFQRSALQRVGGYDPRFTRAQDWEMNHRIIESGGLVWFTPALRVIYRPRPTLRALSRQYFQYGQWRRVVMRQHGRTRFRPSALRYLAPPALVLGVCAAAVLASVSALLPTPLQPFAESALVFPAAYALAITAAAAVIGRRAVGQSLMWLPLVIATMHVSWGCGFIRGARLPR